MVTDSGLFGAFTNPIKMQPDTIEKTTRRLTKKEKKEKKEKKSALSAYRQQDLCTRENRHFSPSSESSVFLRILEAVASSVNDKKAAASIHGRSVNCVIPTNRQKRHIKSIWSKSEIDINCASTNGNDTFSCFQVPESQNSQLSVSNRSVFSGPDDMWYPDDPYNMSSTENTFIVSNATDPLSTQFADVHFGAPKHKPTPFTRAYKGLTTYYLPNEEFNGTVHDSFDNQSSFGSNVLCHENGGQDHWDPNPSFSEFTNYGVSFNTGPEYKDESQSTLNPYSIPFVPSAKHNATLESLIDIIKKDGPKNTIDKKPLPKSKLNPNATEFTPPKRLNPYAIEFTPGMFNL